MDISRTLSSEINMSAEVLDQYLALLTDHKVSRWNAVMYKISCAFSLLTD